MRYLVTECFFNEGKEIGSKEMKIARFSQDCEAKLFAIHKKEMSGRVFTYRVYDTRTKEIIMVRGADEDKAIAK